MTDWQRFARWSLGEISSDEYADALVAEGASEDDPEIRMLRRHPMRTITGRVLTDEDFERLADEAELTPELTEDEDETA